MVMMTTTDDDDDDDDDDGHGSWKKENADDEIEENDADDDDDGDDDDDDEDEEKRDDDDDDDDGVLTMVDVCTDGVVMMVMGNMILWQSMLAATFWENKSPSRALSGIGCVCPDGWWCLSSCWCLGGLSIVFRWSLASWWHFGGVPISVDGVQWCFESGSCFRGVSVVFWRCSGGVLVVLKKRYFCGVKWFPGQYQIGVNGDVKLCYWGCMLGLISYFKIYARLFLITFLHQLKTYFSHF